MSAKYLGLPSMSFLGRMIWSMAAAPNGDLWFGASHALLRLTPAGEWHKYTRADGLAGDDVLALCVGQDGTVWAAVWEMRTDGYVGCGISCRMPDGTWRTLTTADGLPSDNVRALAVEVDGSLWIGTGEEDHRTGEGAARRNAAGSWERYTITQGLPTNYVEQICVVPNDSTWIITHDLVRRALRLFPDGRRFIYTERDGLIHAWVNAIAVAPDGAVWFGTAQGASRLGPDNRWTNYGVGDGLIHATVVAVAPAPDGAVWFGTPLGLCRLGPDGRWSNYSTGPQRPDHHIYSLCAAPDGSAWAATVSGLFNFRPIPPHTNDRTPWSADDMGQAWRHTSPNRTTNSPGDIERGLNPEHQGNANHGDVNHGANDSGHNRNPKSDTPRHRKPVAPGGLAYHLVHYCRAIHHRRFWRGRGISGTA